jgi:hypothetical protein
MREQIGIHYQMRNETHSDGFSFGCSVPSGTYHYTAPDYYRGNEMENGIAEFYEWYEALTREEKGELLTSKRDRKQTWDSFMHECYNEYVGEIENDRAYDEQEEEYSYMRRNRNEYG